MGTSNGKRAAIVRAAFAVLMSDGVQALSFEAVARSAGLSRQLIRYYFRDPEALMVALCDHMAELYRDALVSGVTRIEDGNRLDFFLDFYFDLLGNPRKPRDDQAVEAVFAFAAGSVPVRSALRQHYGRLGQLVAHEIAVQHPSLSLDECGELSWLFVCLLHGHWRMVATLGHAEEHRHITRRAMDRLIDSYLRRAHPPLGPVKPWAPES